MSTGHHPSDVPLGSSFHDIEALLSNPKVRASMRREVVENNDYDIPYLGSSSKDGHTIYYDRHLPKAITILSHTFNPRIFIKQHELFEKTLIDVLGWTYLKAHVAATGYERMAVVKRFGAEAWAPYTKALRPYIKADEHEKIVSVPKDLDMTPYEARPENKALVDAMHRAMGRAAKKTKQEVDYGPGKPEAHCGPVIIWKHGQCEHFNAPSSCALVAGVIGPRMWCQLWKAK